MSDDDAHNLRVILDAIPAPIFYKDARGIYRGCNKAFEAYLGKTHDEIVGKDVYELSPKDLADVYKKADDELFASRATQLYEARVRYADGTYHDVMFHKATFDDANGNLAGMIGTILDITTRKQAERALKESEQRYRTVVSALGEGIVLYGQNRKVLATNHAAEQILGMDQPTLISGAPWPLLAEDGSPLAFEDCPIFKTLATGDEVAGAVLGIQRPDGSRSWISLSTRAILGLSDSHPTSVVASFADITDKRSFQQQLEHQAFHDPLTGLPNRQLFMDRLHHAVDMAARRGERVAVAFVDLDRFKAVNDTLGHEAGDRLLAEVGRRLAATLRGSDFVARLGGDEFCAILTGVADATAARSIAQRMLAAIVPALELESRVFHVTASIGLSLYPDDATEPGVLLRYADDAMYQVKARGKNAVGLFAPG